FLAFFFFWVLPCRVQNHANFFSTPPKKIQTTPEIILNIVADTFKIAIEDLKSNSRRREISWARQIGMYLMRQYTNLSLPKIGEEFGGKDHTTVMYSCEKITQLQGSDQALVQTLHQLSDRIQMATHAQK
ncbi:MAG: helix-turn-helix domain-containing protein, partial [Cuspidothrix sp.]